MRLRISFWMMVLLLIASAMTLPARQVAIPEPLEPWVDWVLSEHEDLACPLSGELRVCAWPGRLKLDLDDDGGSFALSLHADNDTTIPIPGGPQQWPLAVLDGERSARLRRSGDRPLVEVEEGSRRLSGRFRWSRLPESLPIPPEVGLISLRLRGEEIHSPRRDDGGLLWLAPGVDPSAESERISIEVNRKIVDGVPVLIETRLKLRVSGSSREVLLSSPLPEGFEAVALSSELPTRLDSDGGLKVQLRPGEWQIRLASRSLEPMASLLVGKADAPWPTEETWVFDAVPEIRSVRLEGLPGVDPNRTSLPEEWRNLPAFRAESGATLTLVEQRRGAADPGPDEIGIQRTIWLAQDGRSWTFRDRLNGSLKRGGRLELLEPGELGRVSSSGEERLITTGAEGRSGVEMRSEQMDLTAELTYERRGALPAVGWSRDASSLEANLRLPPGWRLLATLGVDRAGGAWLTSWTLLDLFFLLLISLGCWRLFDLKMGLLAFAVLALSWHEASAPRLVWLFLIATIALSRILPEGRLAKAVTKMRWGFLAILSIQWVVFAWQATRTGIFPQLERQGSFAAPRFQPAAVPMQEEMRADEVDKLQIAAEAKQENVAASPMPGRNRPKKNLVGSFYLQSKQQDLDAIVQTGPGLPDWNWRSHALEWTGPVGEDQEMRLLLISPGQERILSLVRVLGLGILGALLLGWRRESLPGARSIAGWVLLCILLSPNGALEAEENLSPLPVMNLLEELERRLTMPPECHPQCLEVAMMRMSATEREIRFSVDLHASSNTFWRLPGPESTWRPREVLVDGRIAVLRRLDDGFLALRLVEGSHKVTASGLASDGMTLRFPLTPRFLEWRGEAWTLEGFSEDAVPPSSVRLSRQQPIESNDERARELAPWVQVVRRLDLGIPWLVHNEIRRIGPSGVAVLLKVPLIGGENVTSSGVRVEEGFALIRLEAEERQRRWESTLEEVDSIALTAPLTSEWTETWELACSPIFSCQTSGLAASRQIADGVWMPAWQPWPGESLKIDVARPPIAEGVATTIHQVDLSSTAGRRLRESRLSIRLRTSQGGEQSLALPDGAEVQHFEIDGNPHSVRQEDRNWIYSLEPGEHLVDLAWREAGGAGLIERSPAVLLDRGAANVKVTMSVPENRWLLWTGGPSWGPVVSLWQYVFVLFLVAWALSRFAPTPLRYIDWLLLGAGMTQVPLFAPVVVVTWLLALALRDRFRAKRWWTHNLYQLVLFGLSVVAMGCLWAALQQGLLVQPDMQVVGGGSFSNTLVWYVDRIDGALPRAWVLWLPLWCWRITMLVWALWLASRLMKWIPWGWSRFGIEGLWRRRLESLATESKD